VKEDCAIVVAAKDSYAETWSAFFGLFFKYWPDCPFDIFMLTEKLAFSNERIKNIIIPINKNALWEKQWEQRIRKTLKIANKKYFIFFHTDYFLNKKIDNKKLFEILEIMETNENIGYVRLFPDPPAYSDWNNNKKIGLINKNDKFSLSLQTAIWRTGFFNKILKENYGPIDLETIGSREVYKFPELLLGVKKNYPVASYINGIKKGCYQYETKMLFKKEGILFKPTRPVESFFEYILRISTIGGLFSKIKRNFLKYYHYQSNVK